MQQIQKPISDFLGGKAVTTIAANANVLEAINKMSAEHSECLLVIDNDTLIGIFTERDFLNRVVGARLIPADTPILDVMTPEPDTLGTADGVSYAVERMASRGFRNIPIVDDIDPTAVLSVWDVMSHLSEVLVEVDEDSSTNIDEWTDIGGG